MNLFDREEDEIPFKSSLVLDEDEIKVVAVQYKEKPICWGIGTAERKSENIKGEASVSIPPSAGIGYQKEKEFDWNLFYNRNNMPNFLPILTSYQWIGLNRLLVGW